MRPTNRIAPLGQVQDYRTFQILAPASTHRRKASCAEVNCTQYLHGWRVRVDGLDPQMLHTAKTSGRKYTELHVAEGENWLVFEAGQSCFKMSQHSVPLDKRELFIARDGDFRGNPTGNIRKHTRPEFWVEEMSLNLDKVRDRQQRHG
jgi:hypothetical protein